MIQAVIDDSAIYTARRTANGRIIGRQELARKIYNAADIVEICRPLKIESVWIQPGSQLSQASRNWFFAPQAGYKIWFDPTPEETEDIYTVRFQDDPDSKHVAYASARREKVGGQFEADINIMYPEWGTWCEDELGQHWQVESPRDLLATVLYLSDAFEIAACISPGNMGKRLMKSLSRERLTDRVNCSDIPFADMTMDYIWMRRPTPEEKRMKYLHQYDKNRQYTGAAQSVRVGVGEPVFVPFPHDGSFHFDEDCVGIWRVDIDTSSSLYNSIDLPCPINAARPWVSTDLIVAARKMGIQVSIYEGYAWWETAKSLDKWASHMWDGSKALRDNKLKDNDNPFPHSMARENAFRTSKLMSNATIGRLNRTYSGELYRPDINRFIIERGRANGTYTIEKYRKMGYTPAHVYRDAYYYFSDEPDPALAVPGMLAYSQELRGYKHEKTYPVTPELLAAFALGETSAPKGHNMLKRLKGVE